MRMLLLLNFLYKKSIFFIPNITSWETFCFSWGPRMPWLIPQTLRGPNWADGRPLRFLHSYFRSRQAACQWLTARTWRISPPHNRMGSVSQRGYFHHAFIYRRWWMESFLTRLETEGGTKTPGTSVGIQSVCRTSPFSVVPTQHGEACFKLFCNTRDVSCLDSRIKMRQVCAAHEVS